MIAVREYTSAAEMRANAASVHNRLVTGQKQTTNVNAELMTLQREIKRLKMEALERDELVKSLMADLKQSHEKILALEMDKSDFEAIVLAQAVKICGMTPTEDDAVQQQPKRRPIEIIEEVLRDYPGILLADVRSPRRGKHLLAARHACVKAVYEERKDLSLPQIGTIFNRDHTTILHAARKMGAERT